MVRRPTKMKRSFQNKVVASVVVSLHFVPVGALLHQYGMIINHQVAQLSTLLHHSCNLHIRRKGCYPNTKVKDMRQHGAYNVDNILHWPHLYIIGIAAVCTFHVVKK